MHYVNPNSWDSNGLKQKQYWRKETKIGEEKQKSEKRNKNWRKETK